ncbi:MAG TPA: enoyl-CoA hydratase-related protein [Syntrophales bacterium]|jgi:2-(1,2-epoxy-1,2-dihydrophenyl)acetyl-CoA isomerase|nr:enoyl-CoA hydratase-related protein [Syntrophales bacterium]HOH72304.1 enoyl-CoA hydratase-related protein [Syntrophales bacterium]HPN07940.1 enoyl-CoA hydratase-related protein [Syntrophales bacterium]HPX82085.1 enoyl-CoA hydratase-related protein [Syntrophales bacterium]HQB13589.1 enoyl-CoA hydratase-related protein [Syntrophales bacterium]
MNLETIILNKEDGVTIVRLNRPKEFNALDFHLLNDLARALEFCSDDKETRAVVITGEGKAFCAGGDVSLFRGEDAGDTLRQLIKLMNTVIITIRRMQKPIIAMINGMTAGGGMSIVAACDLRICGSSAKFKTAYTASGLVPDGGWALLMPLLMGFGKASEMAFMDPLFGSKEALDYGFVTKVVEDTELENTALHIARNLASGPSVAFALVKENLNNAFFSLLERQLEVEKESMTIAGRTSDVKEGMKAFAEKRKPIFMGR